MNQSHRRADGKGFQNAWGEGPRGLPDVLRWMFTRKKSAWPEWVDIKPTTELPPLGAGQVSVTFINHASFLIRTAQGNVLVDPVFSERTSPVGFAGPKRVHAPGVPFDSLPKISLVVISHNHYDHLDLATLRRLALRDQPAVVVPLGNAELVRETGLREVFELDWWQEQSLPSGIVVRALPARHFSGRSLWDRDRALWASFEIRAGGKRVYFAGDTGYGPHFREIRERAGTPDVALLPIGAYEPRWFMGPVHMNPEDAVKAFEDLGRPEAIGMHFGTFQLTDEKIDEPGLELGRQLKAKGIAVEKFRVPRPGESFAF